MKKSGYKKINTRDVLHGALIALLTSFLTSIVTILQTTPVDITKEKIVGALSFGIGAFITYMTNAYFRNDNINN